MANSNLSKFLGYVKLNDSASETFRAYSILESLGLSGSIEQPVMICEKFYSSDSLTVEYYSNHTTLLTSLICSTLDRDSENNLARYFSKFFEMYRTAVTGTSATELLKDIEEFSNTISISNVADLDNIMKTNKRLLQILSDTLRANFVKTFIRVYNSITPDFKTISIDDPLFVSKINVSLSVIKSPVNVVIGSRFCNRLFPIKQSRLNEDILDDTSYEKYKTLSSTYKNLDFASNKYLYNPRNCNSIIYSYLLMDCVQNLLVDILSSKDGE